MRLSPEAIQKFKEIYKKEFGEELSEARAQELGLNLLRFFDLTLYPSMKPDRDSSVTSPLVDLDRSQ